MKKIYFALLFLIGATPAVFSQLDSTKLPPIDKSPMDMSYYPADYPVLKISDKASEFPVVRIIYGRPQKNGRPVFGSLVEYGKVWRLGANEATEIEFYKDVTISNKKIKKGRYTLYAIPEANNWTIIINKDTDTWGAFKYDMKNDVLRTSVPVIPVKNPVETLSITFVKTGSGCNLLAAWDNAEILLPVLFK